MLVYLPQSPPIVLESPSLCLLTQSGCFPPTRFVALKCLKLPPSLSALSLTSTGASPRSDEGLFFSLSVILNLLHYSLQTLLHCTQGSKECKHGGGKIMVVPLFLLVYGCLPAAL